MLGYFFKICNGWGFPFLKGLYQHDIFYGSTQGMPGKPLGIGNTDTTQMTGKSSFKGCYFRIRTPAPGRGIGFMGHEQKLVCIIFFFKIVLFFHL